MKQGFVVGMLLLLVSNASAQSLKPSESIEQNTKLEQSEAVAKQYLDSFRKTGVPTFNTVKAAVEKAKKQGNIEAWTNAAAIANAYANVIDVLKDHYSGLYYASRAGRGSGNYDYINRAADYEKIQNRYLQIRNDAYIELAKLYAAKGDKARALSYVVTAIKLSGAEPNTQGEALIKQYIELSE